MRTILPDGGAFIEWWMRAREIAAAANKSVYLYQQQDGAWEVVPDAPINIPFLRVWPDGVTGIYCLRCESKDKA